jgi:site-specific recombinase XerD
MELNNKILEDYFSYLTVIKARSPHTISEFRVDLRLLFKFVYKRRKPSADPLPDCSFADIKFIKSITLDDMYAFIAYLQKERNCSVATCGRKIISIRQFWKYLKTKAHLIDNNITEELEVPKQAKRIPKYLNLEDSIRLLMSVEDSPRNYCIVTLFLNCALRLAELTNLNVEQISAQSVTVIGKGDKERQIYLTPAAKNAVEAAGLSQDITPHKLRHTAATLLYKHGNVDIRALKEILGHESLNTTQIYTHLDDHQLQTAVNTNPLAGMVNRRQQG